MQVKNISGKTLYIGLPAPYKGKELANNAIATFENLPEIENAVRTYITAGTLELVSGPTDGVTTQAVTNPAWGLVKFAHGGAANDETVTINGTVFRWDDSAANAEIATPGCTYVGAAADDEVAAAAFIVAVNTKTATTGVRAEPLIAVGADTHVLLRAVGGTAAQILAGTVAVQTGANYTLAESGTNQSVSGATFFNGSLGKDADTVFLTYTVTAANVTDTIWAIPTGLPRDISFLTVQVMTAAGRLSYDKDISYTALFTLKDDANGIANMILVTDAGGGTNTLAAGDFIKIIARA